MEDKGLLDQNKNSKVENGKLAENEEKVAEANGDVGVDVTDKSLLCGWRSWRPKFLQKLVNPKWFILFISIFSFTQGLLVNGFTSVCLPDIEKEFGFSSKESGFILASNDISALLLVPLVSFFGGHGNKPKWIGYGALITGLGALVFSLPKAMIGKYEVQSIGPGSANKGICVLNSTLASACLQSTSGSTMGYLMVFSLGQMLMGAGTTPLYTLGPAYLDENVNPKMSPIYLGIWFATTFLGPGLGYIIGGSFLRQFTNVELPKNVPHLTPEDPRWIGAWWMGYFLLSWSLLFCGVSLLGYPREMPFFKKKRLEAIKGGDLPTDDAEIGKGWRDMIRATLQLFKNITYICSTLGLTVRTMYGVAIGSFFAKILVLKFGGSSYVVGIITGCVMVPGMFLGILGGSFIMKKVKLRDSAKTACKISFALGIVTCFGSITWIIPGCGDTVLAGATVPYHGSTNLGSVTGQCNIDCGCSRSSYLPTCGSDGITYFSPCHAGCTSRSGRASFANCTCMPITSYQTENITIHIDKIVSSNKTGVFNQTTVPKGNSSVKSTYEKKDNVSQFHQTSFGTATFGRCDRGCKNLSIFLVLSCVLILVVFITATPQKMIILRCVPDNQRSYALGLQFLCMRSLSFIPGPVIFGAIIDGECTLWSKNACGKRGNCLEYKVDSLSISILIFGCVTAIIGTLMYALAWYFYVPAPTANEDDAEKSPGEKNILITDDPPVKKIEEDNVSLHSVGKLVA